MKRFFILAFAAFSTAASMACTNFIVGKGASADSSVILTYNADSYGMYGNLYQHKGTTHAPGMVRKIFEWDTNRYLGNIDEALITYDVVGQMNENQVSITETTFGGREELVDSTGVMDYGSLIYVALERSKSAREAIQIMTSLVEQYGYFSEGETFSICDKNEAWVMEMVGMGPGSKCAAWVAVRIPDECISAHANQSRITKFLQLYPKKDVLYNKKMIKFAREKGWFTSKNDKDFSFRDAFAPADFSANRYCEARVWSFFNHHVSGMDKYLNYVLAKKENLNEEMPLYLKPDKKVSLKDIKADMRDHYEGTALDVTQDLGAGAWNMPYRPSPLSKKVTIDGKEIEVFNERPTSTQQTGFSFIGQMRSWLPDGVGGIVWWTNDDPNMAVYTPIYCCIKQLPECYLRKEGEQDEITFNWKSAFWLENVVANMIYPYYSKMFPDLLKVRNELEDKFEKSLPKIEELAAQRPDEMRMLLTTTTNSCVNEMMKRWNELYTYLVVKHNDMVVKKEEKGKFKKGKYGFAAPPTRPGYSTEYWKKINADTNNKYIIQK